MERFILFGAITLAIRSLYAAPIKEIYLHNVRRVSRTRWG
jgi:hypothetical protein